MRSLRRAFLGLLLKGTAAILAGCVQGLPLDDEEPVMYGPPPDDQEPVMYGPPPDTNGSYVSIEGHVVDQETSAGIVGIQVRALSANGDALGTGFSTSDGAFAVRVSSDAVVSSLSFTDVDGEDSGGQYAEKTVVVDEVDPSADLVIELSRES